MSRVINPNKPTTVRNQSRRTIAEMLRRLTQRHAVDEESKDMAAAIVFMLRDIDESVMQTVTAWEKRGYWMKADRFMREWEWARIASANFEDVIRNEAWDLLAELMADLFTHVDDVQVKKLTRSPETWRGAYNRLMAEPPGSSPW